MNDLLYMRELVINQVKKRESIILFVSKFIVGLLVFGLIFSIGFYREEIAPLFSAPLSFPFMMLLAVAFAFLPPSASYSLISLAIVAQVSQSMETALFVLLLLACVIIFYVRLSPVKSYLILAIILGFYFKLPYAVVIFAGLYAGVSSIVPIALGTCIYYYTPHLLETAKAMQTPEKIEIINLPSRFTDTYKLIFNGFTADYSWVIITFIFIMVILGIYAVSLLSIDYSKEISIGFGGIVFIMCFVMASLVIEDFQLSVLGVIIGSVFSVALVFAVRFFDSLPNYRQTENLQFEDDENYYYVKIIPKILSVKTRQNPRVARSKTKRRPAPPAARTAERGTVTRGTATRTSAATREVSASESKTAAPRTAVPRTMIPRMTDETTEK